MVSVSCLAGGLAVLKIFRKGEARGDSRAPLVQTRLLAGTILAVVGFAERQRLVYAVSVLAL